MMLAPISSRCCGVSALTAPCVPTGMNAGVSIAPCAVWRIPRRAPPSVWVRVNKMIPDPLLSLSEEIASWDHLWRAVGRARSVGDVGGVDFQAHRSHRSTSRSPIRIEKDGAWTLPDQPPTALSAAEVIQQATRATAAANRLRRRPARTIRRSAALERSMLVVSRSCTARTARTAPCRACSSSRTFRTSARACSPRRRAWTRR